MKGRDLEVKRAEGGARNSLTPPFPFKYPLIYILGIEVIAHRVLLPKLKHTFIIFLSVEHRAGRSKMRANITKSDLHMFEILRSYNIILNL